MGAPWGILRDVVWFAGGFALTVYVASVVGVSASSPAEGGAGPGKVHPWPCRLVVESPLLEVIEDAWQRSKTFRRQCEALAAAHAVVVFEWGGTDSRALARIRWDREGRKGVVVARVSIPPSRDAAELVAHELEHVLEAVRGLDFAQESKNARSGVWKAFGGFETQGAIDAGHQVRRELSDAAARLPVRGTK
jgi:hypothetical protein